MNNFDISRLDIFLIDQQSLQLIGRPVLLQMEDGFSHQILGYYISFDKCWNSEDY